MTVRDLIARLRQMPQDSEVYIDAEFEIWAASAVFLDRETAAVGGEVYIAARGESIGWAYPRPGEPDPAGS